MGAVKNYLNDIICLCSEEQFGQDAVEYSISMGYVHLTGDLEQDQKVIMSQYGDICAKYREAVNHNEAALVESYGPLLDEIADAGGSNAAAHAAVGEDDYERKLWAGL